jgi:CBS domain-containing protein
VYREYGVDPLERHFVDEVMTRDPLTIAGSLTRREILNIHFGHEQQHRAYPVVADGQVTYGSH